MIEQIISDRVKTLRDLPSDERDEMILKIWMEIVKEYDLIVELKKAGYTEKFCFITLQNKNDSTDKYRRLLPANLVEAVKSKLRKFKIESL